MQRLLLGIDWFSTFIGQAASWLIIALTLMISYEVFSRYALGAPHAWVFDASDIVYGFLPPRMQAGIDLVLYLAFFFPGVIALAWAGIDFFEVSLAQNEHSSIAADGPPIYPFKAVIPVAGALLLLQGVAETIRCLLCLRSGRWPPRAGDVEEVDVEKLKELVQGTPTVELAESPPPRDDKIDQNDQPGAGR
jgi:TRAP-type mannitol/chloroaromatic compound transport system permease small subunit